MLAFFDSNTYTLIILPLLIFLARIGDVSIGTIRVIFIARGYKFIAPVLGFFEILIWLSAIRQIMMNITTPLYYIAYAGGFSAGTFVGMLIEEKLSIGNVMIRIITRKDAAELVKNLRQADYIVTSLDAEGNTSKVKVIFTVVDRHDVAKVVDIIKHFNPQAFYTIEDIRFVAEKLPHRYKRNYIFKFMRRGK